MSHGTATAGAAQMEVIAPMFLVADEAAAVAFYVERLGFQLIGDHPALKILERQAARVHLVPVAAGVQVGGRGSVGGCCIYVDNVDRLHEEFVARGAPVDAPPVTRPWGYRDFTVADPDGHELLFAQHLADDDDE